MLAFTCPERAERERIISTHIRPVAQELRSLDLALLLQHVSTGKTRNLESVVEASSELHFRPGTLSCSRVGEMDVRWGAFPKVRILLTFASEGVIAAFVLQLDTFSAGVELEYASFPEGLTAERETERLERAMKNARLASGASIDRCGRQPEGLPVGEV